MDLIRESRLLDLSRQLKLASQALKKPFFQDELNGQDIKLINYARDFIDSILSQTPNDEIGVSVDIMTRYRPVFYSHLLDYGMRTREELSAFRHDLDNLEKIEGIPENANIHIASRLFNDLSIEMLEDFKGAA